MSFWDNAFVIAPALPAVICAAVITLAHVPIMTVRAHAAFLLKGDLHGLVEDHHSGFEVPGWIVRVGQHQGVQQRYRGACVPVVEDLAQAQRFCDGLGIGGLAAPDCAVDEASAKLLSRHAAAPALAALAGVLRSWAWIRLASSSMTSAWAPARVASTSVLRALKVR